MNPSDIAAVYPEIIVTVVAMIVLVAGATLGERRQGAILAIITVAGLLVAFASVFGAVAPGQYFRGFVTIDAFTTFFRAIFILLAVFAALVSPAYLARRRVPAGEYYAIICFSTVGAMTIALSSDLITLFVGLETMTIPIYVLAGIQRTDRYANEAALKYFLLGAFSSALLLYGFVWLYGVTHATDFATIAGVLAKGPLSRVPENTIKFAVGLLLTSFGCFWGAEGAGVDWPGDELSLLGAVGFFVVVSLALVRLLRRRRLVLVAARAEA